MALGKVDWSEFISQYSEVSPDVTFLLRGEDGGSSKFGAHRLLLAGVSPVFKRMFYGPIQTKEEEVEVKDASPDAFQFMIDYIYKIPAPTVKSLNSGFEIYALGDRYDVLDLKAQILDWIQNFKITRENFSEAATLAESFKLLGDPSTAVAMHCLRFYLESPDQNFPGGDSADILNELMEVGKSTLQLSGNQFFRQHIISSLIHLCRLG